MSKVTCLFVIGVSTAGVGGCIGPHDEARPAPGDLAVVDLAPPPPPPTQDASDVRAATGGPCMQSADCLPSAAPGNNKATCQKKGPFGGAQVTWTGGYCESPCRPAKNDENGVNPDCPGDGATCVGVTSGICFAGCASIDDCRDDYVCALASGTATAICIPLATSECDPKGDPRPGMKSCPMAERCVSYSPDASYGGCAEVCDPIKQGCPPPTGGANGCVVDLAVNDGSGACIGVNAGKAEGDSCIYLNDCPAGMMCYARKCRTYCRAGGDPCPMGQTCKDITLAGLTIKFKADVVGICTP